MSNKKSRKSSQSSQFVPRPSESQLHFSSTKLASESGSPLVPNQKRSIFKRLVMNIGAAVGHVEKTEYPQSFLNACKDMDAYKVVVEEVSRHICKTFQQSPGYVTEPLDTMDFEYKQACNPYELLEVTMSKLAVMTEEPENAKYTDVARKLALLHRDYQAVARKSIHFFRTFLRVEYPIFCAERKTLNVCRQELDFARHEFKSAKTPEMMATRKAVHEQAIMAYTNQMNVVQGILDQLPRMKNEHVNDINNFVDCYVKFHEKSLQEMKKAP